eukprot:1035623-Pleurochrysis_carterae.AAC.2
MHILHQPASCARSPVGFGAFENRYGRKEKISVLSDRSKRLVNRTFSGKLNLHVPHGRPQSVPAGVASSGDRANCRRCRTLVSAVLQSKESCSLLASKPSCGETLETLAEMSS